MSGDDRYEVVAVFAGGEVLVDRNKLVVLGRPVDETDETSPRFHNCDQMGCGSAHVIYRGLLATRCGYCGQAFVDDVSSPTRLRHALACGMNPLVKELERLKEKRTVGELLATTPRGTIVEYNGEHDGALFRQTRLDARPGLAGVESRWFTRGAWACWRSTTGVTGTLAPQPGADVDAFDLRRTGRVVLDADADRDPLVRGLMPRDDGGAA